MDGTCPFAADTLLFGRDSSTAVSRRAAFSWVNQSVFCRSLRKGDESDDHTDMLLAGCRAACLSKISYGLG